MVQWLRLCASNAEGAGLIPGWGTRIPHAMWYDQKNINFYWSIVALQYCVRFYCTIKWISYMYTYIASFWDFFLIYVTTEHWVEFSVLYGRFSLVIYFIYSINGVHMSIPISQFIPPFFPPWCLYVQLSHLVLCFCFVNKIIYTIFLDSRYMHNKNIICIWYLFFSFWLSSL